MNEEPTSRAVEATIILAGGLASALGIVMIATGRSREAYALGAAGALFGASAGAVRILGRRSTPSP